MDKNPFPEFKLFNPVERLKDVGRFIGRVLRPFPEEAPDYMSNHNRGAEAMLSRLQEPTDGEALEGYAEADTEYIKTQQVKHYVDLAKQANDLKKQEE